MSDRPDFFRFRRYLLELDGVSQGAFEEFLSPATALVEESSAAGRPTFRRHPLRLLQGVANTRELLAWLSAAAGQRGARTAVVVELDDEGEPARRHTFAAAWPVSVELATLSTEETHSDVAVLSLSTQSWTVTTVERAGGQPVADDE